MTIPEKTTYEKARLIRVKVQFSSIKPQVIIVVINKEQTFIQTNFWHLSLSLEYLDSEKHNLTCRSLSICSTTSTILLC